MKKIFVVMQKEIVDTIGGTIVLFVDYCNMLNKKGYDVWGLFWADKSTKPDNLNKNIKYINLKYLKENLNTFDKAINYLTEKEKPDLFLYFFPNHYAQSKLNNSFNSIPRILMFHGRADYYFNIEKNLEKKLKKYYKNTICQILFPSYINLLPEFINKDKIYHIPNPIDINNFKINTDIEKKKIIFLSRIAPCKGIDFLIKSAKIAFEKYPTWSIDIYGQSQPDEYKDDLNKLIKKNKLENNIFIKGITNNTAQTFLNYDFCVFPSYIEGFPLGLIEALSMGIPSIGLRGCSGVNELIIDNYNGYLSDLDAKDFAEKMIKLINSKELRKKMSENAINSTKKYNKEKIYDMWIELIENVLNNNFQTNITNIEKAKYKLFPIKFVIKKSKYDDIAFENSIKRFILNLFSIRYNKKRKQIIISIFNKRKKINLKNN